MKPEKAFSPVAVSSESHSWFGNLKKLLSFNPTLATATLAVLIVCVGAALLAFNFTNRNDVAGIEKNKDITVAAVSPTVNSAPNSNEANGGAQDSIKLPLPVKNTANTRQPTERERAIAPVKAAVKVPAEKSPKNSVEKSDRSLKNTDENNRQTTTPRKTRVPNLNDIEDVEDKSVRLMDLFEEIDTK